MAREKQNMTFYRDGTVLMSKCPGTHVDTEYDVVRDETDEAGVRTIVLREKDVTVLRDKARRLATAIAEKIGEADSAVVHGLLFDVFKDYHERDMDRLLKMVATGQPVKVREGCFKVVIGDGRRRTSAEVMLRE